VPPRKEMDLGDSSGVCWLHVNGRRERCGVDFPGRCRKLGDLPVRDKPPVLEGLRRRRLWVWWRRTFQFPVSPLLAWMDCPPGFVNPDPLNFPAAPPLSVMVPALGRLFSAFCLPVGWIVRRSTCHRPGGEERRIRASRWPYIEGAARKSGTVGRPLSR